MMETEMIKRALIAGAAAALDYKEKNPKASESEIMSNVIRESRRLIRKIEED